MEKILIEVSAWQKQLARSKVYWIVATLTGVACGFAPYQLYMAGTEGVSIVSFKVIFNFFLLYFAFLYYAYFGNLIIVQIRNRRDT